MNLKALGEAIGLEEDEYRELAELFLETGRADYNELNAAMQAGDAETVSRKAHTLCGAAGNLGLMNIYEVAKRIELAALDSRLDGISGDVRSLSVFFDEIAQCL